MLLIRDWVPMHRLPMETVFLLVVYAVGAVSGWAIAVALQKRRQRQIDGRPL